MHRTLQKVCGGVGWVGWVCKPILVLSFGQDLAELASWAKLNNIFKIDRAIAILSKGQAKVAIIIPIRHIIESESLD